MPFLCYCPLWLVKTEKKRAHCMKSLINHFDDSFPLFVYKHMPVLCHCIFPCFNCFKAFFFLYNCSWLVMWACRIIHKLLHIIHMHIFSVIHNRVFLILKERKPKKKKRYWIYLRACVWNCRLTLLVFIASVAEQKIHSFHSHPAILFLGGLFGGWRFLWCDATPVTFVGY